jgi:ABC-type proline/glycine betaine transport system permease subunit
LGDWIEGGLDWLTSEFSTVTRSISQVTQNGIDGLTDALILSLGEGLTIVTNDVDLAEQLWSCSGVPVSLERAADFGRG